MTSHDNGERRRQLDEKLKSAERLRPKRIERASGSNRGISIALRMTTELVAAVFIGVLFGLGMDWLTGWSPLFLIIFFMLGAIAGFLNVIRASEELGNTNDAAGDSDPRHDKD